MRFLFFLHQFIEQNSHMSTAAEKLETHRATGKSLIFLNILKLNTQNYKSSHRSWTYYQNLHLRQIKNGATKTIRFSFDSNSRGFVVIHIFKNQSHCKHTIESIFYVNWRFRGEFIVYDIVLSSETTLFTKTLIYYQYNIRWLSCAFS